MNIIVDIDGTISNPNHRIHFVLGGRKQWKQFFDGMDEDLTTPVGDFVNHISQDVYVHLCSGRPEEYRQVTLDWIQELYPLLFNNYASFQMRPTNDQRKDSIVKKEMLNNLRNQGFDPVLAIDDRQQVVDMWVDEELTCLQHVNLLPAEEKIKANDPGMLTLLVGPSGAGKTTKYSKNTWLSAGGLYISSDDMRRKLTGDFKDQSKNTQVFAACHEMIQRNLELGFNVCFDATNIKDKDRKAILKIVPEKSQIIYYVIDRPLSEKIEDGGWRNNVIMKDGKTLIEYHHSVFQNNLKNILVGDMDPRVEVWDRRI